MLVDICFQCTLMLTHTSVVLWTLSVISTNAVLYVMRPELLGEWDGDGNPLVLR